jgi:biotin transport system substrate-specific component
MAASLALPARRPVLAESLPVTLTRGGTTIVLAVVLTALAAQVSVPVPGSPVPVTGQTFAVGFLAAAVIAGWGARRGAWWLADRGAGNGNAR